MAQNVDVSRISEFGRKKRQRVFEGAGLLLSLLRNSNNAANEEISGELEVAETSIENSANNFSSSEIPVEKVADIVDEENGSSLKDNSKTDAVDNEVIAEIENYVPPTPSYVDYDFAGSLIEILCESSEYSIEKKNNFLKGCKWSPDGCSLLTCSDDKALRIFSLPQDYYQSKFFENSGQTTTPLACISKIQNAEIVYDFCWYPFVCYPNTHCTLVAVTSRDHPIHLWNIQDNVLSATFSPMNHVDELTSAHSIAFNCDGRKLYAGFKNCVRIFDVLRPGQQIDTKDSRGNKTLMNGQNGIISCIATCPTDNTTFVCGSYHKTLGLYSEQLKDPQVVLHGHSSGITHVCYHPNGNHVYSGTRKNNELFCWDVRNLGSVLFTYERVVDTNQRIYFDIDRKGQYLMSGSTDGIFKVWNLQNTNLVKSGISGNGCINGVSFNPFLPLLATSSGQRNFDTSVEMGFANNMPENKTKKNDNCIKLWCVKNE